MERSNPNLYSRTGSGSPPQGSGDPTRPGAGWEDKKYQLIAILGDQGQEHFTSESRVLSFLNVLDKKGVPITDHASVKLVFGHWRVAVAGVRARLADPAKAEKVAPAIPAPDASHPAGLKAMFAQEGTFKAKPASFIAKFIAFVAARDVDPTDKDLVASLLPPFLDEIEKAARPTARALINAMEAGDAEQVERMLKAGLDPTRIVLRPDRPPTRQQLHELARLATRYDSASPESRGLRFAAQAVKVLPSLNEGERPKYPGRNALTLALACNAGIDAVSTICLWVADQREAGKACDLLDRPDGQGCTPLVMAVEAGDRDCVELLLDHGAKVDLPCPRPNYGYTPLMAAVCKGNGAMAELLLKEGADPRIVTAQGGSALALARKGNDATVLKLIVEALPESLDETAADAVQTLTPGPIELAPQLKPEPAEPTDPFEKLFHQINLYKQDPKGTSTAQLVKMLKHAPIEWARRLAATYKSPLNDRPIHSKKLEQFYAEISELAGAASKADPADSDLRDLANHCIEESFYQCSTLVNLHDGAKLLDLIQRDKILTTRHHPDAALNCVQRIFALVEKLRDSPVDDIGGTQLVASLVTADVALRALFELVRKKGGDEYQRMRPNFEKQNVVGACHYHAQMHLIRVSSRGSAALAARMFLDAFRIYAEFESKGNSDAQSATQVAENLQTLFSRLGPRGQRHALKQLSKAEFVSFSASFEETASHLRTVGEKWNFEDSAAYKAVQEFKQGRRYAPPTDSALINDIRNQMRAIETKHVGKPDLRTKTVGEAISGRIRQFVTEPPKIVGPQGDPVKGEAMAQTFVNVFSSNLRPEERTAVLRSLTASELLTVRSWFDDDNDTTRVIDAIAAERI